MKPEDKTEARLRAVQLQIRSEREASTRYSYLATEALTETLAARLLLQIPSGELPTWHFAAIPRGGWIVLGMLSYLLDLHPAQLTSLPSEAERIVIVDDCALTGARIRSALAASKAEEVVLAHLASPEPLRRAVEETEARVRGCVVARDLPDRTTERFPAAGEAEAFRERWHRRAEKAASGTAGYWYGWVDPIAFAWSEPDHPFWNAATEHVEDGWRLFPPHRVLKTRAALGPPVDGESTPLHLAEGVVLGDFDGVSWLVAPGGEEGEEEVLSVSGVGRLMLRGLLRWGEGDAAVEAVLSEFEASPEEVRRDLAAFARDLESRGLVVRPEAGPSGDGGG